MCSTLIQFTICAESQILNVADYKTRALREFPGSSERDAGQLELQSNGHAVIVDVFDSRVCGDDGTCFVQIRAWNHQNGQSYSQEQMSQLLLWHARISLDVHGILPGDCPIEESFINSLAAFFPTIDG